MRTGKPLLPQWRYWPACAFAVYVLLAAAGWSLEPPAKQQSQSITKNEIENPISELIALIMDAKSDQWIAVFTGLTGVIFLFQLLAMRRDNEHFRVVERAYVKVSPVEPGAIWDGDGKGGFKVVYKIKNFGSTPARVTDVISNAFAPPNDMQFDNEIPDNVRHAFPKETLAFLVKDDEFYQYPHTAIDDAERPIVESGAQKMIVLGYADYIDQFGVRHRAGFGRQYLPNAKTLNLVFPDTGKFNYDRVRKPGEGIDRNEA
jgi:hypothetical protein